ncbi:hypothetical protein CTEN210_18494 [Chaetoceros tenuissimus]|uniref:SAP domain-containing protein n=1 Tax=Chaetoceros tenuissimus TaxID=426638 RepID=A0AAD3DCN5_9STRA|nr:hypothetical protein CTEN210_18494 [Chaetoceros tenuissimus]
MSNQNKDKASIMSLSYREMQKLCKDRGLAANGGTNVIRDRLLTDNQQRQPKTRKRKTKLSQKQNGESVETSNKLTKRTKKKTSTTKAATSRKRQKIVLGSLTPPKEWESIWSLVEELRADKSAPIDSDGGPELPEKHLGEKVYRFQSNPESRISQEKGRISETSRRDSYFQI